MKEKEDYDRFKLFSVGRIGMRVIEERDGKAIILAEIDYKDKNHMESIVELINERGNWLITRVSYYCSKSVACLN